MNEVYFAFNQGVFFSLVKFSLFLLAGIHESRRWLVESRKLNNTSISKGVFVSYSLLFLSILLNVLNIDD